MRKLIIAGIFSLFGAAAAQADIVSTFNTDTQGWTVVGDEVGPVTWVSSGGNPGGYVSVTDSVVGGVMYFVAPDAYFGDHSGAYGTALTFDLIQRYPDSPNQFDDDVGDVVLKGSGLTLAYDLANNPVNGTWTPYSVSLTAGSWRLDSLTGQIATQQQVQLVLSDLTGLEIRAEYQTGPDTDGLDSVVLNVAGAPVPEPSTWAMMILGFAGVTFMAYRRSRKDHGFMALTA
jgi:laminin B (domain IV)/PEP-CTERM motif-containing protein